MIVMERDAMKRDGYKKLILASGRSSPMTANTPRVRDVNTSLDCIYLSIINDVSILRGSFYIQL
jgi:hypothetical protein